MILTNDHILRHIASLLAQRIGEGEYFNGTVRCQDSDIDCALTSTLIVYRRGGHIVEAIPVWWEFSTATAAGEVSNDFCWEEFYEYLREYF